MRWGLVVLFVLGLCIAAAAVIFGPMAGVEALATRVAIAVAALLPVPLILIIRKLRTRSAETALAKAQVPAPVSVPPEVRAQHAAKLAKLKELLDASKVAGDPLHLLPRVMLLGPESSGKTSALRRSRLELPFTTAPEGGSHDLEVWVSRQGTIVDVPGRYFTDEGVPHAAYLDVLQSLARARRPVAVDTLVAVIDLAELLTSPQEEAEALAARLRRRVHEAIDTFGWSMPVIVLFTRCDRLPGFVECYGVLPGAERAQALGFIFDGEDDPARPRAELDLLLANLRAESHARLSRLDAPLRAGAHGFPEQLGASIAPVEAFLRRLREPSALGDRVRLGGVYFASAGEGGRPVDRVAPRLFESFGVRAAVPANAPAGPDASRSFFLHELFSRVVLPGAFAVRRSVLGRRRYRQSVALGAGVALIGALAIGGLSALSYANNRALISSTVELVRGFGAPKTDLASEDRQLVLALGPAADRLEQLERWEVDGPPLSYGFGFYGGSELLVPVRRAFERSMQGLFVERVGVELESILGDPTGSGDIAGDYDVLKVYLMLTNERERLDVGFAARVLLDVWKRRLDAAAAGEPVLLEKLATLYLREIERGAVRWRTPSTSLIAEARASLLRRNAEYERIVATARKQAGRPIGLQEVVGGRIPDAVRARGDVERLYTLEGWRKVRSSFEEEPDGAAAWVLGSHASDEIMLEKAREQYYERFIEEWRRFLRELSIREAKSLPDARRVLEELTVRPSILELLIRGMKAHMTFPSGEADALAEAGGKVKLKGPLAKAAGAAGKELAEAEPNRVQDEFAPLFELVDPAPSAAGQPVPAGLAQLLDKLTDVKVAADKVGEGGDAREVEAAVAEARAAVTTVFRNVPEALGNLFKPLILDTLRGVTKEAETERYARTTSAFSAKVCDPFQETIAGRYPFVAGAADDALLDSVTAFFGPGGVAWGFFDESLKEDLVRVGDSVEVAPKRQVAREVLNFYKSAMVVRSSLFPGGASALEREIQVRPQGVVITPGTNAAATGVTFELGGERKTYRFGPAETWTFKWPAKMGQARLSLDGLNEAPLEAWGEWALFRLLDRGEIKTLPGGWIEIRFPFKQGKVQVPLQIRTGGTLNPFVEYKRFRVSCPRSAPAPATSQK